MAAAPAKGGLLRSSAVVSVMTLLSRVLCMVRDIVVAAYFGSGSAADAFFVAFKIPNFLRRLFAEGAFAQAFVPVLAEYQTQRSFDEVKLLVARTAGSLGLVLSGVTLLGVAGFRVERARPLAEGVFGPPRPDRWDWRPSRRKQERAQPATPREGNAFAALAGLVGRG